MVILIGLMVVNMLVVGLMVNNMGRVFLCLVDKRNRVNGEMVNVKGGLFLIMKVKYLK